MNLVRRLVEAAQLMAAKQTKIYPILVSLGAMRINLANMLSIFANSLGQQASRFEPALGHGCSANVNLILITCLESALSLTSSVYAFSAKTSDGFSHCWDDVEAGDGRSRRDSKAAQWGEVIAIGVSYFLDQAKRLQTGQLARQC